MPGLASISDSCQVVSYGVCVHSIYGCFLGGGYSKGGYVVCMCYQLAFSIPGILPVEAHALKVSLATPNLRINPLGLPVIWHLLRTRTGDAFFGSLSRAV